LTFLLDQQPLYICGALQNMCIPTVVVLWIQQQQDEEFGNKQNKKKDRKTGKRGKIHDYFTQPNQVIYLSSGPGTVMGSSDGVLVGVAYFIIFFGVGLLRNLGYLRS